jgi:hypothetical protein
MNDQLLQRVLRILGLQYLDADAVLRLEILNCMNFLIAEKAVANES